MILLNGRNKKRNREGKEESKTTIYATATEANCSTASNARQERDVPNNMAHDGDISSDVSNDRSRWCNEMWVDECFYLEKLHETFLY